MELRQLRYFLAVAREGTFGRASEVLHVAQPALSRQIQKLEQELGTQLFVRHQHGVSITPAGLSIHARARHVLDEVDLIGHSARAAHEKISERIKIAVSPGTAEIIAFPLSCLVADRFPAMRCEIISMVMPGRAELLVEENVAFALMNEPATTTGFTTIPLIREPLCLLCRSDDERFRMETLDLGTLASIPLIIGGASGYGIRSILTTAFSNAGLELQTAAELNTVGASKAMVLEGFGPTVHVAAMARSEIERGELRAVRIDGLYATRVLAIPKRTIMTPTVENMIEAVRDCFKELVKSGRWINGEILSGR